MADINAWYSRLLAADEARDAAALAALAWQMYGQLATTAADLGALRAGSGFMRPHRAPAAGAAVGPARSSRSATARRLRGQTADHTGDVSDDGDADRGGIGAARHRRTTSTTGPAARNRPNQDLAASRRLGSGASMPSPAGRPNEGHRRGPHQDTVRFPDRAELRTRPQSLGRACQQPDSPRLCRSRGAV